jgi:drug/metabolite transporter (DMT)-like permease
MSAVRLSPIMTHPRHNLGIELALLALLALFLGSSYLFIKVAVAEIAPLTLVACRVTIAAIILLSVVHMRGERLPRTAAPDACCSCNPS